MTPAADILAGAAVLAALVFALRRGVERYRARRISVSDAIRADARRELNNPTRLTKRVL